MKPWFILCCLFIAVSCSGQENSTQTRLLNLEKQWMKALVDNDTAFIKQLYHPDITYIHASGQVDNKSVFIQNMKSGALKYVSITPSDLHVAVYGKTALITYRALFKAVRNGQPVELDSEGTDVYCQFGKKWQMVAHQTTRVMK